MTNRPSGSPRRLLTQLAAGIATAVVFAAGAPAIADDRRTAQQSIADPGDEPGGGGLSGGGGLTNDNSGNGGDSPGGLNRIGVLIPIGDDGSGRPLEERVPEILASLNPAQLMLVRSHCWSLYSAARNWTGDLRTFCSEVIDRE